MYMTKIYLEVNDSWVTDPKINKLFKDYDIIYLHFNYYEIDLRFIRKIKISKLEKSTEFDAIAKILFDKENVKFLKTRPSFNGTTGYSGSEGTSGTSGYVDSKFNDLVEELCGTAGIAGPSGTIGITADSYGNT